MHAGATRASRTRGDGWRRALGVVALASVLACEGGTLGTTTGPIVTVGGGSATTTSALVGRWARAVFVDDGYGGWATSETTWEFAADSVATRALVTSSPAWAYPLVTFSSARWRTDGRDLVVRYVSPDTGTVRFRWRIERRTDGDLLFLDETAFARVSR